MKTMNFLTGAGIGMVVGAAVGMMIVPKQKKCRTGVARALRSAGDIIDGLSCAMGL